jgi:hypothetical protein
LRGAVAIAEVKAVEAEDAAGKQQHLVRLDSPAPLVQRLDEGALGGWRQRGQSQA